MSEHISFFILANTKQKSPLLKKKKKPTWFPKELHNDKIETRASRQGQSFAVSTGERTRCLQERPKTFGEESRSINKVPQVIVL